MPLNAMTRSVFIAVLFLGAIVDFYGAEQPEPVEQKPEYTRVRELPALKISSTDMQSVLEKSANLLSSANAEAPKEKKFFFRESLTLGTGPDEIQIAGHRFPADAHIPKAAYALRYSYSWTDAPVSKVELELGDITQQLTVSGTAVDQVEAISAALERDLSQHSAIGGYMVRNLAVTFTAIILLFVLLVSGTFCILERQWRFLGIPIFSLLGLVLLFALPFKDLLAGFALYQGEPSWIVRYEPQMAFASLILAIAGIALSFLIPAWREGGAKENSTTKEGA